MPRRLAITLPLVLTGTFALSSVTFAAETFEELPDTAVSVENTDLLPDGPMAEPIAPDPTVVDPRPHAWDRIVVAGDGRTLDIYFWMGIEECNGLHSVNVSPTDRGIDVLPLTGRPAGMAPDTACIEIAQLYVTTVVLEAPLIGNAG